MAHDEKGEIRLSAMKRRAQQVVERGKSESVSVNAVWLLRVIDRIEVLEKNIPELIDRLMTLERRLSDVERRGITSTSSDGERSHGLSDEP